MIASMPKPVLRSFPMLSVASLPASLRFYVDLLGGEEDYRFPPSGDAVFVTLRLGTSELGIGQLGAGPALHGQPQRPAQGHRMELCMYVRELERVVGVLSGAGTPILLQPSQQPWGERVAYVSDPDGNLVFLIEENPSAD
jgi:lactoylglutathione lyase